MGTPELVTRTELARLLDCHPRTIVKWTDESMPVAVRGKRGRPSRYDVVVCRAWKETRDYFRGDRMESRARRTFNVGQQRGRAAVQQELEFLLGDVLYSAFTRLNGETPTFEDDEYDD